MGAWVGLGIGYPCWATQGLWNQFLIQVGGIQWGNQGFPRGIWHILSSPLGACLTGDFTPNQYFYGLNGGVTFHTQVSGG